VTTIIVSSKRSFTSAGDRQVVNSYAHSNEFLGL